MTESSATESKNKIKITCFYRMRREHGGSDGKESSCNVGDPDSIVGQEDPLEKGMATHSSVLAWIISWTELPGRLQSMGSQGAGHN